MTEYNFLNLSSFEFEVLSRDLLQKLLGVHIESFTSGPDGGIDLRCSVNGRTIIQCKRYSNYSSLKTNLAKELKGVKKNNPDNYIIMTSVSMTPNRKSEISNLFSPYINSTEDIYGKEDLNNLIGKFPEIEKNHYKLWLSSVNILQLIVDRNIINQSQFAIDDIQEKIKVYVQNNSFAEATEILKKDNYVVISGIPGIGKTTLAEILTYDLLANGVDDFIYLSDTIEQGYRMFNTEKSQVFLFDDFLGRNFLENSISTNEESQILKFIKKIKSSKNKFLIFTTREYILKQAKQKFDLLDNTDLSKCIIDLSKYTKLVRAKILYNHLFFNGISSDYIQEIKQQEFLNKVIDHKNYNPRIIETITNNKEWESYAPSTFPDRLFDAFENPESVWEHAFENAITELSRIVMYNYLIVNRDVTYKSLYKIVSEFCEMNQLSTEINTLSFKKAIKELEGTFISITKRKNHERLIEYQNPSIQDFLVNYANKNDELKTHLIIGSNNLNPLLRIFSDKSKSKYRLSQSLEIKVLLNEKIVSQFENLDFDTSAYYNNQSNEDLTIYKLHSIIEYIEIEEQMENFIFNVFTNILYSEQVTSSVSEYINLILFFKEKVEINLNKLLLHLTGVIEEYEELMSLNELRSIDDDDFESFISENNEVFDEMVNGVVANIESIDTDPQETIDMLKEVEEHFFVDVSHEVDGLNQKIEELEYQGEMGYEEWKENKYTRTYEENVEQEIENLFDSFE